MRGLTELRRAISTPAARALLRCAVWCDQADHTAARRTRCRRPWASARRPRVAALLLARWRQEYHAADSLGARKARSDELVSRRQQEYRSHAANARTRGRDERPHGTEPYRC